MSWPSSQDYNESIQDPRQSFADTELKTGEAVTNPLGIPLPRSGNFADVYEVRCPSGTRWAVKCFTREVHGLRERYHEVSKYLHQVNLPFMVDFQYLEQGIRVRGQWYPILKMQWVEGFVLNEFVRDNLDKKPILQALGQIWLRMGTRLREAKVAHCDLQHGNVMFVPGSTANSLAVKLIDYDGMCVPALTGTKSGEVGHPAYQHPERLRTGAYDQKVDRFSLLSIAAALRCLAIGGRSLWERYDNGDNLLFRQADLQAPAQSPLFQELLAIRDPQAQTLVKELYRACQGPLAAVPLLTDLLAEEKAAGKVTKTQIASAAIAQQVAGAQGPDWDFGDDESGGVVVKKQRPAGKMPPWAWGALGGAAAVLLLGAGLGAGLALRGGSTDKPETLAAQNKPDVKPPTSTPKPPAVDAPPRQQAANEDHPGEGANNPPAVPHDPPPKPPDPARPVEAAAAAKRIFQLAPTGDKLAISGVGDNTWRLVDPRANKLIRRFTGHTGPVTGVAFSADGRRAVTCDRKMIHLWNVHSGQVIDTHPVFGERVIDIALSPDGKAVATVNGGSRTDMWDFESRKGGGYSHNNRNTTSVAFSPDGRYFVCGFDTSDKGQGSVLFLWPLAGGGVNARSFPGPAQAVSCLTVSPDGKYIAVGHSGGARTVSLWDAETGKLVRQHTTLSGPVHQVAFSPDGRILIAGAGPRVPMWKVAGGQGLMEFDPGKDAFSWGGISADGKDMLCANLKGDTVSLMAHPLSADLVVKAPAPAPRPAGAWGPPIDPDRDCQFTESGGKLTITLPGMKVHDLVAENNRMNSPRLLRNVEGDFTAQVRIGGDFSTKSTEAAGLLLMVDEKTYVRLERCRLVASVVAIWQLHRDGQSAERPNSYPPLPATEGYVRLERRGDKIFGALSSDGEKWTELKPYELELPAKVKLGVAAISVSEPFAPTFDQFQLKQGEGKMVRIDKWLGPAETVVVKPPPPKPPLPPVRRQQRQPVPDAAAVEAAAKDLRASYKEMYANANDIHGRNQLQTALFNERNAARNDPPRHFALLREMRDNAAKMNAHSGVGQAQTLALDFDVNPLEMKCLALEKSVQAARPASEVVDVGLPLVDQAVSEENYDAIARLVRAMRPSYTNGRLDAAKKQMAGEVLKRAENAKEGHDKLKTALRALAANSDDAKANLEVGKFHSLARDDWVEGLPLLARGSDPTLKSLAQKDLANPDDPTAQIKLAEAWRTHAGETGGMRSACRKRAHYWYQQAAVELEGEKLKSVQKAMASLAKPPMQELQNPWWQFSIYSGATPDLRAGSLRIEPSKSLVSRACYRGPLEVTVVAKAKNTDLNISIGAGGRLKVGQIFGKKGDYLQVFRPDTTPQLLGSRAVERAVTPPANGWFTVRWQVTPAGMKVWFEGKVVFEEARTYDLIVKYPVSIHGGGGAVPIEVKSVLVRRGPEK